MVTYQRRVETVCLRTTTFWGLLSHPSAKWRVLARRFNSRQGPFRIEGKVIYSTAQVFLPIGLLWWREGAGHRMSVQGWVTQGIPRTFLFALAWDLLVAAQSLLLNLQRIKIPSECCPNPLSVTPSWLCGKSSTWRQYWSASCTLILNTTLRLVSKPWKATCHSRVSEVYSWCVGKCMISPSCIIPRIRKCDRPGVLQGPCLCCDTGADELVNWEGKQALHLDDSLGAGRGSQVEAQQVGMSSFTLARTETSTGGEGTAMEGAGLFYLGVVPERMNFSLRALKMGRKGKCHCGKMFFHNSWGSWHPSENWLYNKHA